jgi:hypothetical protein
VPAWLGSPAARITDEEGGSDHVVISLERDKPPWITASEPRPGSETSWRNTPRRTVTLEVLNAVLLICLGLLLGTSWTVQALQPTLRRQAEERRRLDEEWSAVRIARRQWAECPRCGSPLSEEDWCSTSTVGDDQPDDD